ncbi:PPOX class F420-dependent oxidoreductase [Dietzia cinnamea]|uniref:PPOX class F420-dependent oxidoreductase n=1 Tax=Dietzia cinnamea TaxID=321318 RepID=UPI003D07BEC5
MPKYATAEHPDRAGLEEFLRSRHRAILITRKSSGGLQSSPVTCGVGAEGRLTVATYPQRAKVLNIRRDPAVSVCVLSDEFNGPYVHLDGRGEIIDLPEAVEPLVDYFRSVAGEHDDWEEYRAAMVRQGKCLIRVTIDDWGPIATGGFPPEMASRSVD